MFREGVSSLTLLHFFPGIGKRWNLTRFLFCRPLVVMATVARFSWWWFYHRHSALIITLQVLVMFSRFRVFVSEHWEMCVGWCVHCDDGIWWGVEVWSGAVGVRSDSGVLMQTEAPALSDWWHAVSRKLAPLHGSGLCVVLHCHENGFSKTLSANISCLFTGPRSDPTKH